MTLLTSRNFPTSNAVLLLSVKKGDDIMLKATAASILLASFILLSACAAEGNTQLNETTIGVNTSEQEDISHFESGMFIDLKAYEDQLADGKVPVLTALKNNLVALVEHSHNDYKTGFVTENLAEAMKYYYGEQFRYRFTEIESMIPNPKNDHLHITVLGQRLDTTTQTIEDFKMMYAIGQNDQGDWVIYTID